MISLSTLADGERRPGWVGLQLTGVSSRLVDDDGAEVPHDGETIGRLEVRGPTLFDGYRNRPDATAEVFDADGWYRTGDVVLHAPPGAGPNGLFVAVPDDKVVQNRIHFDFRHDDQQAEVESGPFGACHVDIGQGDESWVVLADPEGTSSASSRQTTDATIQDR